MHPLVEISKWAVEEYVRHGKVLTLEETPPELREPSGVFVCLKKRGQLRGCIGTIEPCLHSLAEEAIANAISSATQDPRFLPVEEDDLEDLTYSVDVLTPPEAIEGPDQLDPRRYGVVVESGSRRGLLLPDLEGVDTAEQQVAIARRKAGIPPGADIRLYRFEVQRFQ